MLFPYLRVEHMCGKLISLDVTFSTKVRWTVGLPACSEVEYSIGKAFYLRTVTVVLAPVFLVHRIINTCNKSADRFFRYKAEEWVDAGIDDWWQRSIWKYLSRICTGYLLFDVLVFTGKEVPQMLTTEGLIAVFSLALTAFGLGYAIGRNTGTRE